jgi:hypothetical protein|tara:strand:- start:9752 stop:9904 length:153 start_codon:yes stop_codon:yes gene_type:complete
MSNYNVELKGLNLLYHFIKNRKMSYDDAVKEMQEHNQDMSFLNELGLEDK